MDDPEPFQCIICLELVYKPIVHACGHLFCFWCVHRAMNGTNKNLCPLCRRPYMHFPRICEQLHFVLLKAVHDKYLIRVKEVEEEEAQRGIFSPQLDNNPHHRRSFSFVEIKKEDLPEEKTPEEPSSKGTESVSSSNQGSERGSASLSHSSSSNSDDSSLPKQMTLSIPEFINEPGSFVKGKAPMPDEGETDGGGKDMRSGIENYGTSTSDLEVAVSDLVCMHCSNLLYRPVVLNCGHMFCEHCVVISEDEAVSCPSCKADHPGIFPQVCLELHHYIDRVFPLEYAQRSLQVASDERDRPSNRPRLPESELDVLFKGLGGPRRTLPGPIHRTVGCDGCGMMPIAGKRFQCKDCPEAIGFDLCEKCHESGCVVGRFNQRHAPDHHMVEIRHTRSFLARHLLDFIASSTDLSITDLRIIANECNESEAIQVLARHGGAYSQSAEGNGVGGLDSPGPGQGASADGDGFTDIAGDGVHQVHYMQEDDNNHDNFLENDDGAEDGQDDEEFELLSRDDEDIEFYRVVFHA